MATPTPSGVLAPITKQPVTDLATNSLRDHLLSGAMQPGARLTEVALAEQLGIARTTVRASLNELAFEGLVVKIPYTGWEVTGLTAEAVWEIWTLRGSLESLAARITAGRMDDPEVRKDVEDAANALLEACSGNRMDEVSERDFALHRTLVDRSRHSRLIRQYGLVARQVRLYIVTSNSYVAEDGADVAAQHHELIKALLAGDVEGAAHESWLHNEKEGRRLATWLDESGTESARTPAGR